MDWQPLLAPNDNCNIVAIPVVRSRRNHSLSLLHHLAILLGLAAALLLAATFFGCFVCIFSLTRSIRAPNVRPAHARTPIIVWHGLGDSFMGGASQVVQKAAELEFGDAVEVVAIRLADDPAKDAWLSVEGNIVDQISAACEWLGQELARRGLSPAGVHAVGLSQGGLFIRALAQQCKSVRMRALVTFGAPHQGVWGIPPRACSNPLVALACTSPQILAQVAYLRAVQSAIVPTTFLKLPENLVDYKHGCILLPNLNGERDNSPNSANGLGHLEALVLVKHSNDTMLLPQESAWFGDSLNGTRKIVPLRQTDLYKRDTIGLRQLDKAGRLVLLELDGDHLEFSVADMRRIMAKYMSP